MVLVVWAFWWMTGVFSFEEEAAACKVLRQEKQKFYRSRCQKRMEKIRDSAFEGWMARTLKKGKGAGKNKGRVTSGESGPGEDRSWGSEASNLRQEIQKELGAAEMEGSMEAVAGGSGIQRPEEEGGAARNERTEDDSSSEEDVGDDGSEDREAGSSEVKVLDEVRKDIRATEKKARGWDSSEGRREEERDRDGWRKTRSGSARVGWKRDMGAGARS